MVRGSGMSTHGLQRVIGEHMMHRRRLYRHPVQPPYAWHDSRKCATPVTALALMMLALLWGNARRDNRGEVSASPRVSLTVGRILGKLT